jgi:hypothetical protein
MGFFTGAVRRGIWREDKRRMGGRGLQTLVAGPNDGSVHEVRLPVSHIRSQSQRKTTALRFFWRVGATFGPNTLDAEI